VFTLVNAQGQALDEVRIEVRGAAMKTAALGDAPAARNPRR
jgi:hypothetical protein